MEGEGGGRRRGKRGIGSVLLVVVVGWGNLGGCLGHGVIRVGVWA